MLACLSAVVSRREQCIQQQQNLGGRCAEVAVGSESASGDYWCYPMAPHRVPWMERQTVEGLQGIKVGWWA
jgi:hypothetical protein